MVIPTDFLLLLILLIEPFLGFHLRIGYMMAQRGKVDNGWETL